MGLSSVLASLRSFFAPIDKPCAACQARDYHIASLKERIHFLEAALDHEVNNNHEEQFEIIKHITGMNRIQNQGIPNSQVHIPRTDNSIGARVRRAETESANPALAEQRRKEYNDRINNLIRPEVEVVENAEKTD